MSITIKEVNAQWGIARSTIYKHITQGKISRLSDGNIDVSEVVRVYGEPKATRNRPEIEIVDSLERQRLDEKIRSLESQLQDAKARENWLISQVETAQETIKLLKYKEPIRKQGLFARVVKAIVDE